ncbi:MAG: YraN family protein [Lentisphaeria bacterium]|nr:YraN family protein [Lentisphaeria bacterium]
MKSTVFLRKHSAAIGSFGENTACSKLISDGMTILARNWRSRAGELDIVAFDGTYIIFAEVKTRRYKPGFPPLINLSYRQRKRNFNAAKLYLKTFDISGIPARFDLIEVTVYPGFAAPHIQIHHGYLPDLPPLELPSPAAPPSPLPLSWSEKLLFSSCPACSAPNPASQPFCPACMAQLYFFDPRYRCNGCGGENHGTLDLCSRCLAEEKRPWQHALAVFAYRSCGRELIRKFKFRNQPELARPLGKLAADLLNSAGMTADMIVPIPLNPLRCLQRSYNQSALIAGVVSDKTGIPYANILRRKISLRKQSSLNRKARHQGLKNAFYTGKNPGIKGKHILLIDDVLTTGSTLSAAANTLLKNGAAEISILVIAGTPVRTAAALKPIR